MKTSLESVLADSALRDILRALVSDPHSGISKLKLRGPQYFTYRVEGDEVLADLDVVATIEAALSEELGAPVTAVTTELADYPAEVFLQLPAACHRAVLLAVLAAFDSRDAAA